MLAEVEDVRLYLARVLHRVEGVLDRAGFIDVVGSEHFWHSISQCVRAARLDTGLKRDEKTARRRAARDRADAAAAEDPEADQDDDEVEVLDDEPG